LASNLLKGVDSQSYGEKSMKKTHRKPNRSSYRLGDLILAVSSCSRNSREAIAAVADLLESGQVRLQNGPVKLRARLV
jgi:hypothetical protein